MSEYAIELSNINKHFGPVYANRDVNLKVRKGEVHGIVGENGAGKSTLMSILYGFYTADTGNIRINGVEAAIKDSKHALSLGIGMVHQHFMLVENFTVLENVVLGAELSRRLRPTFAKARSELIRLAREYGLEVDPDATVEDLSVGLQQRIEILKALYRGAEILILDEPTGVLTPAEADQLFRVLDTLRRDGKTVLIVTHKLREIMAITDSVSVMRQGTIVATMPTKQASPDKLAELMVGRRVLLRVEKRPSSPGATLLEVSDLTVADDFGTTRVKDVSLSVRAGEIVGIAGVAGNGQSELLEALTGMRRQASGSISINGKPVHARGDTGAALVRDAGLAHVPEDRHKAGLITGWPEWENSILGYQDYTKYGTGPLLNRTAVRKEAMERMEKFDIRPRNTNLKTANFSGGNQQKIVLAREMERDPDVLIVGQPTRGVDIGAIEFIHKQLISMRDAGKAVLLVSVELDEIRSLSDRIVVMFDGKIVGEVDPQSSSEGQIGLMMAGIIDEKEVA